MLLFQDQSQDHLSQWYAFGKTLLPQLYAGAVNRGGIPSRQPCRQILIYRMTAPEQLLVTEPVVVAGAQIAAQFAVKALDQRVCLFLDNSYEISSVHGETSSTEPAWATPEFRNLSARVYSFVRLNILLCEPSVNAEIRPLLGVRVAPGQKLYSVRQDRQDGF